MKLFIILSLSILFSPVLNQDEFLDDQKRYPRVRSSINEKEDLLKEKLETKGLTLENLHILIVAYKSESLLELYCKNRTDTVYSKLTSYTICASSGEVGPKRKQGDMQVPEGFYHIDRFNPASTFYLSLGINYPNIADRRQRSAADPGGDIFIHGSCVTIGCLPMTNDKIKELYLYAVHAKNNGQQKIPVYIFPFKMTTENWELYRARFSDQGLISFWENLETGYDLFKNESKELAIRVNSNGDYIF
ncbi:MAG: L,D-transpeptidase family protein [Bacteroidales bacterium]